MRGLVVLGRTEAQSTTRSGYRLKERAHLCIDATKDFGSWAHSLDKSRSYTALLGDGAELAVVRPSVAAPRGSHAQVVGGCPESESATYWIVETHTLRYKP